MVGIIVPTKIRRLAKAIGDLFENPAERTRLSEAGRWPVENFAAEFTQHYQQVIARSLETIDMDRLNIARGISLDRLCEGCHSISAHLQSEPAS